MSRFTERLWNELVREHGAELAQLKRPATHGGHSRPRVLAGTTLGLAAAGAAIVLVLGAAGSSPAFAVTKNHDGTVTVEIKRIEGITGANAKLAALGVRARAVAVVAGCARPPFRVPRAMLTAQAIVAAGQPAANVVVHARIDPRQIPAGRTLVLPTARVGSEIRIAKARSVRGVAPACVAVARAPFPAAVGQGRAVQCRAEVAGVGKVAAGRFPGIKNARRPDIKNAPRPDIENAPRPDIKKALPLDVKKEALPRDVKKALARVRNLMRRIKAQGGPMTVKVEDRAKIARALKRPPPFPAKIAQCREIAPPALGHPGTAR